MARTTVTPPAPPARDRIAELEARLSHLESFRASMSNAVGVAPPAKPPSLLFTNLLQGVTLVTVVAAAFWLGSLNGTVSATASKLDKLSDSVSGASRDSMSSRLSVIETRLDSLDKKLDKR